MIIVAPEQMQPTNSIVLRDWTVGLERETDTRMRVALTTSENHKTPYLHTQIYQTETPNKYILNYGFVLDSESLHQIQSGQITTMELIVSVMESAMDADLGVFDVSNGELWVKWLKSNLDAVDEEVSPVIDEAIVSWLHSATTTATNHQIH